MSEAHPLVATAGTGPEWRRSLLWLAFLGPFFFLSYGFANGAAARRGVADSVVFGWERHIPFLDWTIVPYWSIDLIYGLSFLYCRNRREADCHGLRLLTAQLLSVACFLLFPLRFTFERPATDGAFGWLFDTLAGFDQPYNQAPSLHIGLLVILWSRYAAAGRGSWPWLASGWFALIGLSTLTTYQHHFLDLPTGALVGFVCLWLWPDGRPSPLAGWERRIGPARRRLALYYLIGAAALTGIAVAAGGAALWLLWAAVALGLVALCYAAAGAEGFQKRNGRHSLAVSVLAAPYLIGAWLNSRWWTRRHPEPDPVAEGVWLGRMPTAEDMAGGGFAALFDCTAELPAPAGPWRYDYLPWLDLVPPESPQLAEAAARIEALRVHGPVLVCCALGYSRSAAAVASWLLYSGGASTPEEAIARLESGRRGLVLGPEHRAALAACREWFEKEDADGRRESP
jgi:protein-tyrosine phosphatase/membrane-associated phospholipid phosphatase